MANYQIQSGTTLEGFEAVSDWTVDASGTAVEDTTYVKTGTNSLKLTSGSGTFSQITKTISLDLSRAGNIYYWVYIPSLAEISDIRLLISSSTTFTTYFQLNVSALHEGWNKIYIGRDQWTNVGGESWANTMVRIRIRLVANASVVAVAYLDSLTYGEYSRPKCVISFDDIFATVYTIAFPYMRARGLKGTMYLAQDLCNSSATYATTAQIQEIYNTGWDVSNHTKTHGNLSNMTLAVQTAEINDCNDWILSNGWSRNGGYKHIAYPGGAYNANTELALSAAGMLTGRTIINRTQSHESDTNWLLTRQALINSTTLAVAKGYIDRTIAEGGCIQLNFHDLVDTPGVAVEYGIDDFKAVIDYLIKKQSEIDVVTLTEWQRGINNPRKLA